MINTWWRFVERHPRRVDAALLLVLFANSSEAHSSGGPSWWLGLVIGVAACLSLLWRRSRPGAVFVFTGFCAAASLAMGYWLSVHLLLPVFVALYELAVRAPGTTVGTRYSVVIAVITLGTLGPDADDQALLRATFRILIDSCEDLEVVDEAADGGKAVELACLHRPGIVLMDIRMPGTDGLAATEDICADPDLRDTRVLILTTFQTDEHVARALRAGANGFLGKDASADALLDGIRTVASGDALLSATATRSLITRFLAAPEPGGGTPLPGDVAVLTAREREVTALVADGKSDTEIAAELFVGPLTVRTHVQRAKTKLNARDRAQLVVIAYQSGFARPPR